MFSGLYNQELNPDVWPCTRSLLGWTAPSLHPVSCPSLEICKQECATQASDSDYISVSAHSAAQTFTAKWCLGNATRKSLITLKCTSQPIWRWLKFTLHYYTTKGVWIEGALVYILLRKKSPWWGAAAWWIDSQLNRVSVIHLEDTGRIWAPAGVELSSSNTRAGTRSNWQGILSVGNVSQLPSQTQWPWHSIPPHRFVI